MLISCFPTFKNNLFIFFNIVSQYILYFFFRYFQLKEELHTPLFFSSIFHDDFIAASASNHM